MSSNDTSKSLDLFNESISRNILAHAEAIYWINKTTQTYSTIKTSSLLEALLDESGSYQDMFSLFFLSGIEGNPSEKYKSFIQKGLPDNTIYSSRIHIRNNNEDIRLTLTYFPEKDKNTGYMVLFPLQNFSFPEYLANTQNKMLAKSYLYTMLVDLDDDKCFHPYVAELDSDGISTIDLPFSEWRNILAQSFPKEFLSLFLEKTSPPYVRKQMESDKRYSFELQMSNLEGKIIWARHSIIRIKDEEKDHLAFIYTVQDIEDEKKLSSAEVKKPFQDLEPLTDQVQDSVPISARPTEEPGFSALSTVILDHVEKEIKEHYREKLSLQQMADKYFINSAYLGQLFIRKYKVTFHEYLNTQRMNKAAQLLINTSYPIRQIIDMVGISSPHYFNRLFHTYFGCTPTFYRKTSR